VIISYRQTKSNRYFFFSSFWLCRLNPVTTKYIRADTTKSVMSEDTTAPQPISIFRLPT